MAEDDIYRKSAILEREVRQKLEKLLPPSLTIERASKYTESDIEYQQKDRLPQTPPDYYINRAGRRFAVVDVTSGVEGYTVRNSRRMKISENKLEPLTREGLPGYVIMVVIGEKNLDSQERYVWCEADEILRCPSRLETVGKKWKKELNVYCVSIGRWKIGLETFVRELTSKLTETNPDKTTDSGLDEFI